MASPPSTPPQAAPSRGETLTPETLARMRSDFLRHASAGALLDSYELGDTVGAPSLTLFALFAVLRAAGGRTRAAPRRRRSVTARVRCAPRRGRPRGIARAARRHICAIAAASDDLSLALHTTRALLTPRAPHAAPGTGTFGVVKRAVHRRSRDTVAVKILRLPP